ncbi:MAG: DUF4058 family protein [Leptolyngbyaceae cyanobacterium CSU_1_3]|nr:DUF4058 family protein [Leptolyngbyaceae cyanobacterium CSU_1_3]
MPSPFPGMNPYLEQPVFWSEFHNRLIVAISDALTPQLRPKYYVAVETRTYTDDDTDEELLVGVPDALVLSATPTLIAPLPPTATGVAVHARPIQVTLPMPEVVRERYLEVREVGTDAVVTVVELLSPKNKRKGQGRTAYENKRQQVLKSLSHLVEIDLLRAGVPMAMRGSRSPSLYRILVSPESIRPTANLYGFGLPEPIPPVPLPLKSEDAEVIVDLQAILLGVYDRGSYELRIDYRQPVPPPKLSPQDQQWVDELLEPLRSQ